MSTNEIEAGVTFLEGTWLAITSSRGSGIRATPAWGLPTAGAWWMLAPASARNRHVIPDAGSPTIPHSMDAASFQTSLCHRSGALSLPKTPYFRLYIDLRLQAEQGYRCYRRRR